MRTREHFLLGTETVTISVTARGEITRQGLFAEAIRVILARHTEEYGSAETQALLERVQQEDLKEKWRIRPEDSCWNQT